MVCHTKVRLILLSVAVLAVAGACVAFAEKQKEVQLDVELGVEMICDINHFNYADIFSNVVRQKCPLKAMKLTYDLGDPDCDYVVRGDFYVTSHSPGSWLKAQIEVYQNGSVIRMYEYSVRMTTSGVKGAVAVMSAAFVKEWLHDFCRIDI